MRLSLNAARKLAGDRPVVAAIHYPPFDRLQQETAYSKLLSISDDLMWRYYELLTDVSQADIERMKASGENPRDLKVALAKSIITDFHSSSAAQLAEDDLISRFVKKEIPDEIEEKSMEKGAYELADLLSQTQYILDNGLGLIRKNGQQRRGESDEQNDGREIN